MEKDTVVITRVAEGRQWHALDDDEVAGRGFALHRPDGRVFLSVDAWADDVFHELAATMLSDLPAPLYTVVDDNDREVLARWKDAGFVPHRREREYVIPTDPEATMLDILPPPPDVAILPAGRAEEAPLRELDRALREEVGVIGWQSMPAEVFSRPDGSGVIHPERYAVAVRGGAYVGLARVAPLPRRPRLGLIAVTGAHRRRGIARALLREVLGATHRSGLGEVSAEVDEFNEPARELFEGVGARHIGGAVELVHR